MSKEFHHKKTFDLFKNIIIQENTILLKKISETTGIEENILIEKYLKPEYYLPIITKCPQK